nr:hypothetical protein [Rickettsia endosymbiont of Ixodes pacificus]
MSFLPIYAKSLPKGFVYLKDIDPTIIQNMRYYSDENFVGKIDKSKCFTLGYIAERSSHSRGSTVDLSIIKLQKEVNNNPEVIKRKLKDERVISYLDDNTVDMYTSFDLFDEASHHDSKLIDKQYLVKRNYLRSKMQKHNFKACQIELVALYT